MKKVLIGLFILGLLNISIWSETKIIKLNADIMKPDQIIVGENLLYITEGTSISIFSKKDYKLISQFGKKGEGPGEIQGSRRGNVRVTLIPQGEKLYLFNRNKVMYYSNKGKFLNEKRIPTGFVRDLMPVADKYVGRSFIRGKNRSLKIAINIFNKDFSNKKIFYGTEEETERGNRFKHFMPGNIFILKTNKGKVFINDTKELLIKILDQSGKKTGEIKYNYVPEKVSSKTKDDIYAYYKTHPSFKAFYDRIKKRIEIGNNYNSIRNFFIENDSVYVQTYKKTNEGTEFFIFKTSGKFVKKIILPIKDINIFDYYPYYINNSILYQIVENEDEEEWEIHISNI